MNKVVLLFVFILFSVSFLKSQENRGTISVEKKDLITHVYYDNVNYKLVGIDQYGNVLDSAIQEFEMRTTIKGIAYQEKAVGAFLSLKMQQIINKCDGECKLTFSEILVMDNYGNIVKAKPVIYNYGHLQKSYD